PNGRQIVGIDAAGQIEAWNGTATHPRVLGSPGSSFSTVSFNQSGSEFVVASAGGAISVRNARDGRTVTSIYACPAPADAGFSPDGSKLVVACGDGTVRVFDAGNGRPLTVIQAASPGAVGDAVFSPDGTSIAAGVDAGNTGEIQIWNAELATSSLPALERIAGQRVGDKLTAAQQQRYLSGASGGGAGGRLDRAARATAARPAGTAHRRGAGRGQQPVRRRSGATGAQLAVSFWIAGA